MRLWRLTVWPRHVLKKDVGALSSVRERTARTGLGTGRTWLRMMRGMRAGETYEAVEINYFAELVSD